MIFFVLCAGEAGIGLILTSLYRAATKPDVWSFLLSLPGIVFLCSSVIVALSVGWTICAFRECAPSSRRHMSVVLGMNLVMLLLTLASLETSTRLLSKQTAAGEKVLGITLFPRRWLEFAARSKMVINEMAHTPSYLVHDPILGWTVAPSRTNATGQEVSSAEGLRSPRVGMSFADSQARHSGLSQHHASVRVALIGDSMTFGYEVRCEESWAHALEAYLQPHVQVLNFGVSGYGLNQAFLRYEKDVRAWHPQIVVIGMTSEMIKRINSIYPFLMNQEWGSFPFVRPRLVRKNDIPSTINSPIPGPGEIFAYSTVKELPYLDLDDYYRPFQWERKGMWHLLERSYFFRFINSLRPPTETLQEDLSHKSMQYSQFVIQYLVREVLNHGAIPLIVHLPYQFELIKSTKPDNTEAPLSARMLRDIAVNYYDMTACLIEAGVSETYTAGGHYSPKGHAHIAQCLEPVLRAEIYRLEQANRSFSSGIPGKDRRIMDGR